MLARGCDCDGLTEMPLYPECLSRLCNIVDYATVAMPVSRALYGRALNDCLLVDFSDLEVDRSIMMKVHCMEFPLHREGKKTNLDLFFHLSHNLLDRFLHTSGIGMCEITYLTYFILGCNCLRSIVVKL